MTLETWKEEFYPKPPTKRMNKQQAIEHSLKKWKGLMKKNLKKHGCFVEMKFVSISVVDNFGNYLAIDSTSCSLCVKYIRGFGCGKCPLYESLGHRCDSQIYRNSPYIEFVRRKNPHPMIRALRKLLEEK